MKKRNKILVSIFGLVVLIGILIGIIVPLSLSSQVALNVSNNFGFNSSEGTLVGVSGRILTGKDTDSLTEVETMAERKNYQVGAQTFVNIEDWASTEDIVLDNNTTIVRYEITFTNYSTFDLAVTVNNPSEHASLLKEEDASELERIAQNGNGTYTLTYTLQSFKQEDDFLVDVDFSIDNYLLDAVGVMKGNHAITLADTLPADTYTLKYEDEEGTLDDYADICGLEAGESYTGFIAQNMAPQDATKIGVYNSSSVRVGSIGLIATFKQNLGEKLYSFGAISDVHIGSDTAESDFINALTYFGNDSSIKFIANCGDLHVGGNNERIELYKSIVEQYSTKPVYAIAGNHEVAIKSDGYLTHDDIKAYTGQDLYYSYTEGNDVYIMVGMYDVHAGEEFSDEELIWLQQTLEANKDKRCFVFMHLNPRDGSGDAVDLDLAGDMLSNTKGKVFYSLMSHYKNVSWFHGHTHQLFETQEINNMNNYDNVLGIHSVHIPALAIPKGVSADGTKLEGHDGESQGYVVDVYENHIVLRGRDFANGKFLPIASFCLDTTPKTVEANTYYDDTQTIVNSNSNILKEADTWYESSMDKTEITKISFVQSYDATTYDESWDASISGNNLVMAYRTGTEITVVGNENGIVASPNSNYLFKGFTNLTEINGLENIKTGNITSFQEVFNGCTKLATVDISSFDLSNVQRFLGLFKDCSSLTSFNLPNNMGANYKAGNTVVLTSMFENCTSLTEIDLSMLPSLTSVPARTYYMSGTFKDCSALEKVKLGNIKVSELTNVFYRCAKLEEIDMSEVDFSGCGSLLNAFRGCSSLSTLKLPTTMNTSKVKKFDYAFYGCSSLTLDCSAWDTTSCTSYTDFNANASGVTPPKFSEE